MSILAAVFMRPDGAGGLGHVGWGIQLSNARWIVGAMENPDGWPVQLPGWTGFWQREVSDPLSAMRHPDEAGAPDGTPHYTAARLVEVHVPHLPDAHRKMQEWIKRPYLGAGGNCLNCAYDILLAYGAIVPDPTPNPGLWAPHAWFKAVGGRVVAL